MNIEFDAKKSDSRSWPRMNCAFSDRAEFDYVAHLRDGHIVEDVGIEPRGASRVDVQFVDGELSGFRMDGLAANKTLVESQKVELRETLKQLREAWTKSDQARSMRDALNPSLAPSLVRGYDCHQCKRHVEVQTVHGDAFEEDLTCPNCGNELTVHPCFADARNTKGFVGHDPTCVATTVMIGLYDLDGKKIADDP